MRKVGGCNIMLLLTVFALAGCQSSPEMNSTGDDDGPAMEFYSSDTMSQYPFSEAVRVGNTLYLSGQVGTKPDGSGLIEGGIGPETRQVLDNIKSIVEKYGSDMEHVAKCTVMLVDIAEWPALNEIYKEYFPNKKPARSAFAGSGLALGARVEIECIAVIP